MSIWGRTPSLGGNSSTCRISLSLTQTSDLVQLGLAGFDLWNMVFACTHLYSCIWHFDIYFVSQSFWETQCEVLYCIGYMFLFLCQPAGINHRSCILLTFFMFLSLGRLSWNIPEKQVLFPAISMESPTHYLALILDTYPCLVGKIQ